MGVFTGRPLQRRSPSPLSRLQHNSGNQCAFSLLQRYSRPWLPNANKRRILLRSSACDDASSRLLPRQHLPDAPILVRVRESAVRVAEAGVFRPSDAVIQKNVDLAVAIYVLRLDIIVSRTPEQRLER